jgi:hypothetical protein
VPSDCIPALDLLSNQDVRHNANVMKENTFLFPSTNSLQHVDGWSATYRSCIKAGLNELQVSLNATTQRGRLSTLYAAREIPLGQRKAFYAHMGHSEEVNSGTYQRPPAVQTVTRVGSFLASVDQHSGT